MSRNREEKFMAIEYLGLSEINGPLVVLEGVKNASYEEIVEFHMDDGTRKIGRIIEIYEDKAVIQVFEGTDGMSLGNTHTRLTGRPMEIGLSPEILGRTFNGIGQPIDGLGDITPEVKLNINVLLVLVEFIKLIICHIIYNGNNFFKNVVPLFQYGNRHSTVDECTAFFIKIEDRFHHFKLFFHWYAGVFCVKSVLLEEAQTDDSGNTHTRLTGRPMEIGLSPEILGRTLTVSDSPSTVWGTSPRM